MAYVKPKPQTFALDGASPTKGSWGEGDNGNGAAAPETPVSKLLILGAYALIAIATWLGYMMAEVWIKPKPIVLTSIEGVTLFAVLYIFSAAIERLVEPAKSLMVGQKKKDAENRVETARADGDEQGQADGQAKLNETREDTKVIAWSLASTFAILGTSATGLFLMQAIGAEKVAPWLDILITGLVIGAGTKPLHDLIGYIEKKQEESEDEE